MQKPEQLPEPQLEEVTEKPAPKQEAAVITSRRKRPSLKPLGLVGLSIASSVLTVWLLLASGFIKPDATQTISENREKLVLQEGEIVADVFKKVSPSTVAITTESAQASSQVFGSSTIQTGAGSGIIISKDGYILTNRHVVPEGTSHVTVVLADGRELDNVAVVGRDPFNDIAFLKVKGETNLPAAQIGDSSAVEPGQQVVAIGNALGEFRNSVTTGIISGIGRPIQAASEGGVSAEKLENLFQTDAAINPGNSGGPLVNLKGEVIGINTAIAEEGEGIGFAIPLNDVKGMIKTVLEQGKVVKPYLGVRYVMLSPEVAKQLNLQVSQGAYVNGGSGGEAVLPGSPASKASIRQGDVITKMNGQALSEDKSLASSLAQFSPGDEVVLTILRDGKQQDVKVTLDAYPNL